MSVENRPGVYRLGEAVAALGVILSLLFVGVQIRQTAAVASAQSVQDLAAMSQEFLLSVATDSATLRSFELYLGNAELTTAEAARARYVTIAFLRRAEAAFVQVQRGLLPESALDGYGMLEITGLFGNPRFVDSWPRRRSTFNPAFVEYVEDRAGYRPAASR